MNITDEDINSIINKIMMHPFELENIFSVEISEDKIREYLFQAISMARLESVMNPLTKVFLESQGIDLDKVSWS